MKRNYIIILAAVLTVVCIVAVVIALGNDSTDQNGVPNNPSAYDQSTPEAAAKSFIQAMLNGDTAAFNALTKDVIPWSYTVSDLISYATKNMSDASIGDYSYYKKDTTVVVYNHAETPTPAGNSFFGMDFAKADGKYYIVELELPSYYMSSLTVNWKAICNEAIENGGIQFK